MNGSQLIPVVHRPQPFSGDLKRYAIAEGASILEIVEQVASSHFKRYGIACINGEQVPRRMWPYVRPKVREREVVVTLHLKLEGGGDTNDIIKLVAVIAVVAIATVVSAGALGPLGLGLLGASFASGGLGAVTLAAAISVGGTLAINALIPPPTSRLPTALGTTRAPSLQSAGSALTGTDPGAASLSGNVIGPNVNLPRVIGTMRMFPPFICESLVDPIDNDQFAEVVMALAGPHDIADIKVGDVFADDIPELEYEICAEGVQPTLVTRYGRTLSLGLQVSKHEIAAQDTPTLLKDQATPANSLPRWHRVLTRRNCDEFWIPLALSEGVYDSSDTTNAYAFPMRVRFRKLGDTAWVNCPEFHYRTRIISPVIVTIRLEWMDAGSIPTMASNPLAANGFNLAYDVVPAQNVTPVMGGWLADDYFSASGNFGSPSGGQEYVSPGTEATTDIQNIGLGNDRTRIFLDSAIFPQGEDILYEVEFIQGMLFKSDDFNIITYNLAGDIIDLFGYRTTAGQHVTQQGLWDRHYKATVPSVSSVWNTNPVQATDVTSIAFKVHTRQLSEISVLASGLVRDLIVPGSPGWETLPTTATSNPVPHFRDVMIGQNNFDPLPPQLLNDDELIEWHTHCSDNALECNAVVDGQPAFQVASMIASCGFAQPRQCENWGVMIDKGRESDPVVQVFSFRNMAAFRWERAFNRRPSGFRVSYTDRDIDYKDNEIFVLDPGGDQGDRFENIRYDGLVTETEATRRATFDLVQSRLRSTFYFGSANIQNIVARRGDLVGVQHDIIDHVAGSAYIKEILREDVSDPDLITGFILDGTIPQSDASNAPDFALGGGFGAIGEFAIGEDDALDGGSPVLEAEEQYRVGIAIRTNSSDGLERTLTFEAYIVGTESDEVTLVEPYDDVDGLIRVGQLLTSGVFGTEFKRLYLFSVQPKTDLNADLVFIDEAPEVWTAIQ